MNTFTLALRLNGFPMTDARRVLRQLQQESSEGWADRNHERRWEICRHHYARNDFYRHLAGDSLPDRWEDLPILTKGDLQRPIDQLLTNGWRKSDVYVANTSGSEGHPFVFAKDKLCHAVSWALVEQRYAAHGIMLGSREARFYGIPLDSRGYWKERVKDRVANRTRFSVFDLSEPALSVILGRFRSTPFRYLYGYTSAILAFSRYVRAEGKLLADECPSLRGCIITSEVCPPEDREFIATSLGVPVINEYGASELGVLAIDQPSGEMLCSEETTFFETVNDESGNPQILCTSLLNKAFPLIRYRLGDSVELERRDGRLSVSKINGRTNDVVRLPSGRVAGGLTFYYISRSLLEEDTPIRQFVVAQTGIDEFEFEIDSDRELTSQELSQIQSGLDSYLEPGLRFSVKYVDQIQRQSNGKIRHFSSKLSGSAVSS